jgi:hypothetical protein
LGDERRDFGPRADGLRAAFAPGVPRFERPLTGPPREPLFTALRFCFVAMVIEFTAHVWRERL